MDYEDLVKKIRGNKELWQKLREQEDTADETAAVELNSPAEDGDLVATPEIQEVVTPDTVSRAEFSQHVADQQERFARVEAAIQELVELGTQLKAAIGGIESAIESATSDATTVSDEVREIERILDGR